MLSVHHTYALSQLSPFSRYHKSSLSFFLLEKKHFCVSLILSSRQEHNLVVCVCNINTTLSAHTLLNFIINVLQKPKPDTPAQVHGTSDIEMS